MFAWSCESRSRLWSFCFSVYLCCAHRRCLLVLFSSRYFSLSGLLTLFYYLCEGTTRAVMRVDACCHACCVCSLPSMQFFIRCVVFRSRCGDCDQIEGGQTGHCSPQPLLQVCPRTVHPLSFALRLSVYLISSLCLSLSLSVSLSVCLSLSLVSEC